MHVLQGLCLLKSMNPLTGLSMPPALDLLPPAADRLASKHSFIPPKLPILLLVQFPGMGSYHDRPFALEGLLWARKGLR